MTDEQFNDHGLTPKQEAFVHALLDGKNQTDAYRHAYNVGPDTKNETVHWEAWDVMQNPKVTQRIADLQAAAARFVIYGVVEAFGELEEARQNAKTGEAPAAEVGAVKAKMDLLGLSKRHIQLSGDLKVPDHMSREEELDELQKLLPVLKVMVKDLGYELVKIGDAE